MLNVEKVRLIRRYALNWESLRKCVKNWENVLYFDKAPKHAKRWQSMQKCTESIKKCCKSLKRFGNKLRNKYWMHTATSSLKGLSTQNHSSEKNLFEVSTLIVFEINSKVQMLSVTNKKIFQDLFFDLYKKVLPPNVW